MKNDTQHAVTHTASAIHPERLPPNNALDSRAATMRELRRIIASRKDSQAVAIAEFLRQEGFRPTLDEDGDVAFQYEGLHHCIMIDDEDPDYLLVGCPGFWVTESAGEKLQATLVVSAVNRNVKVAKVYLAEDRVWATAELFAGSPGAYKQVFHHLLAAMRTAMHMFADLMQRPVN